MAETHDPQPVKLIAGLLAGRTDLLDTATEMLVRRLGPCDIVSEDFPFTFTHYYEEQMGPALVRRFLSFADLIDPGALAEIKRFTNEMEELLAAEHRHVPRPVNIDPGYVAQSRLVLASAKDFSHRIYLSGGIYAEITLQFRAGVWHKLPWTFPDYGSALYDGFFTACRNRLREQLPDLHR